MKHIITAILILALAGVAVAEDTFGLWRQVEIGGQNRLVGVDLQLVSFHQQRVQLAKECARLAIRRLLPHDKVGIVEFYGSKRRAAPLQSASNTIELTRALKGLNFNWRPTR